MCSSFFAPLVRLTPRPRAGKLEKGEELREKDEQLRQKDEEITRLKLAAAAVSTPVAAPTSVTSESPVDAADPASDTHDAHASDPETSTTQRAAEQAPHVEDYDEPTGDGRDEPEDRPDGHDGAGGADRDHAREHEHRGGVGVA